MRLGWITSNALFHVKLVHITDSGVQHPHAFGQCIVTEMLSPKGWGVDGFSRYLDGVREDYQQRRNLFAELFQQKVDSRWAKTNVPQAGMFFWVEVCTHKHPRYQNTTKKVQQEASDPQKTDGKGTIALMDELFDLCMTSKLVVMPAKIFATQDDRQLARNRKITGRTKETPIEDVSAAIIISVTQLMVLCPSFRDATFSA